jgi:P pilus assembly chaperone PapD
MAKATSHSVVATCSRKLSLAFVTLLSLCTSVQAEASFTLWVSRRITNDLYRLNSKSTIDNCDPNASYLIDEKQCALDEELFNGKYTYACS